MRLVKSEVIRGVEATFVTMLFIQLVQYGEAPHRGVKKHNPSLTMKIKMAQSHSLHRGEQDYDPSLTMRNRKSARPHYDILYVQVLI